MIGSSRRLAVLGTLAPIAPVHFHLAVIGLSGGMLVVFVAYFVTENF